MRPCAALNHRRKARGAARAWGSHPRRVRVSRGLLWSSDLRGESRDRREVRRDGQGDQQEEAQGNPVADQRHLRLRVPAGEKGVRRGAAGGAGPESRPLVCRRRCGGHATDPGPRILRRSRDGRPAADQYRAGPAGDLTLHLAAAHPFTAMAATAPKRESKAKTSPKRE